MALRSNMTDAEIARAVRAGFTRAGADPERYRDLVGEIVADVAEALRAFAPHVEPRGAPAPADRPARRALTDAA
jgi:hypothetical protein